MQVHCTAKSCWSPACLETSSWEYFGLGFVWLVFFKGLILTIHNFYCWPLGETWFKTHWCHLASLSFACFDLAVGISTSCFFYGRQLHGALHWRKLSQVLSQHNSEVSGWPLAFQTLLHRFGMYLGSYFQRQKLMASSSNIPDLLLVESVLKDKRVRTPLPRYQKGSKLERQIIFKATSEAAWSGSINMILQLFREEGVQEQLCWCQGRVGTVRLTDFHLALSVSKATSGHLSYSWVLLKVNSGI